jgi:hypothetical protein
MNRRITALALVVGIALVAICGFFILRHADDADPEGKSTSARACDQARDAVQPSVNPSTPETGGQALSEAALAECEQERQ